MASRPLPPQRQAFVEQYLVDFNATQAAIRAGYSERTAKQQGHLLLQNIDVQRAVTAAVAARTERTQIDQDWVIARLVENVERSMQRVPVLDSRGQPTGEWAYEGNVANAALKLIGQHLGMFGSKLDVRVLIMDEARRMAEELGLPEAVAVAEAERIIRESPR